MRNEQHNKTNKNNRKSEEEIFRTRDMGDKQRMKEQRQKKGEQRVPYE